MDIKKDRPVNQQRTSARGAELVRERNKETSKNSGEELLDSFEQATLQSKEEQQRPSISPDRTLLEVAPQPIYASAAAKGLDAARHMKGSLNGQTQRLLKSLAIINREALRLLSQKTPVLDIPDRFFYDKDLYYSNEDRRLLEALSFADDPCAYGSQRLADTICRSLEETLDIDEVMIPNLRKSGVERLRSLVSEQKRSIIKTCQALKNIDDVRGCIGWLRYLKSETLKGQDQVHVAETVNNTITTFLTAMSVLIMDRLQRFGHTAFPVDFEGWNNTHSTVMDLRIIDNNIHIGWFESQGYVSPYKLSGTQSDELKAKSFSRQKPGLDEVIRTKNYIDVSKGDGRKPKVSMEIGGRVNFQRTAGCHEGFFLQVEGGCSKEVFTENDIRRFLWLDHDNSGYSVEDYCHYIKCRLEELGAGYPVFEQRPHAMQGEGTCEKKSLFALVAHRVESETVYNLVRFLSIKNCLLEMPMRALDHSSANIVIEDRHRAELIQDIDESTSFPYPTGRQSRATEGDFLGTLRIALLYRVKRKIETKYADALSKLLKQFPVSTAR